MCAVVAVVAVAHASFSRSVHDCTPSLSGMASMIDQLNASNNFSAFVQQVRAKFRDLALRGADQHDVDAPAATMDNN